MFIGFSQLLIFGFLYWCWPRLLILYNKIIRSEKWKQWISHKATVEGASVYGGDMYSGLSARGRSGASEAGDTATDRQFFHLPIRREVSSLREYWPACCSKAGGHQHLLYRLVDSGGGCFGGGSLSLPPGAPGPRSQCGYPPGVAGTNPSPFLTHSSCINMPYFIEEGVQRQCRPWEQHRTTTLQAAVGRWVYSPARPTKWDLGLPTLHAPGGCRTLPTSCLLWAFELKLCKRGSADFSKQTGTPKDWKSYKNIKIYFLFWHVSYF